MFFFFSSLSSSISPWVTFCTEGFMEGFWNFACAPESKNIRISTNKNWGLPLPLQYAYFGWTIGSKCFFSIMGGWADGLTCAVYIWYKSCIIQHGVDECDWRCIVDVFWLKEADLQLPLCGKERKERNTFRLNRSVHVLIGQKMGGCCQ